MSKELPTNNKSEEVDLIFIFSALEKMFKKIGSFFSYILDLITLIGTKILIFILFLINLFRKNYKIVLVSLIINVVLFYFISSLQPIRYNTDMLLKQNYQTGKVLYRNIAVFNSLANDRDSLVLAKELNIPVGIAANIIGISVTHNANRNALMEEYFEFKKLGDSTMAITYENFIENADLKDFPIQNIKLFLRDQYISEDLSTALLSSIEKNNYFDKLKKDELEKINRKKVLLTKLVSESDTLQSNYFKLLKDYYGFKEESSSKPNTSTINLSLDNKKDKIETKEYDLFKNSNRLKLEINDIQDELIQKKNVFVVLKNFPSPIVVNSDDNLPYILSILLVFLTIILLVVKELELIKALDKFGTKEKLFEKNVKK